MNCADVQTLARAAPEPLPTPKVSYGDTGNSFDQFLQAVTADRSAGSDTPTRTQSSERERVKDNHMSERDRPVENKPVDQKSVNEKNVEEKSVDNNKKTEDKLVDEKKTDEMPEDQEKGKAQVVDESIQIVIAEAMAAQVAAAAVLVQPIETKAVTVEIAEPVVPPAAVPVVQNQQPTVIQLPDTEPQPLPDELKQTAQQLKVEIKDFKTLVDTASQNLENQAVATDVKTVPTITTTKAAELTQVKTLGNQEPAVKVVDINIQTEDLAEIELNRTSNSVYALASAKTDNLVQPKSLPIIQRVSTEVIELMREQGQSMRLQIHPENLGKIDLRLISNSDGMRVVMTAEVPATAKLLEAHMDQLQRSLADAGVSISGMSVNSQGAQGQSANASLNQSQQSLGRISLPEFQQDADTITPVTVQVASSGLDYRV